ncbi:lipoprotein BA_5634 family protein [Bacillus sp. Brlt_9]|uniref:lipoprotein BA_5634 family protein n=1 Tax=Bacillus sp. Brlt_9 TaxID=3110916 RepID=UPI003F7C8564
MIKKVIGFSLAATFAAVALTGCGLLPQKSNGLILYGSDQQIDSQIKKYNKDLKDNNSFKIKILEVNKQKTLVMSKNTAEELIKIEALRQVEGENTKPIDKLPEVTKEKAIMFAKNEMKDFKVDGKNYTIKYEGNIIIGNGRTYVDSFLIIDDSEFESISGTEKTMGLLKFNKDPKNETINVSKETEKFQMVTFKK